MITQDDINVKFTEEKPKADSLVPVAIPLLTEAIKRLAPNDQLHKIRFDCSDEGAVYTPIVALAQFLNFFLENTQLSSYESIILGSSSELFNISIIGNDLDYEKTVKIAHRAGFSIKKTTSGIYLEIPKVLSDWSNLYAETRNILLTLLGLADI